MLRDSGSKFKVSRASSVGDKAHPAFAFHPDDNSEQALGAWLQFADYYQWPHIVTFDSWEDLAAKLGSTDYVAVSNAMKSAAYTIRAHTTALWGKILRSVKRNRFKTRRSSCDNMNSYSSFFPREV